MSVILIIHHITIFDVAQFFSSLYCLQFNNSKRNILSRVQVVYFQKDVWLNLREKYNMLSERIISDIQLDISSSFVFGLLSGSRSLPEAKNKPSLNHGHV